MIHLRALPPKQRRRCDTAASANARANIKRDLENEIAERQMDARMPKHFRARENFRKTGETA